MEKYVKYFKTALTNCFYGPAGASILCLTLVKKIRNLIYLRGVRQSSYLSIAALDLISFSYRPGSDWDSSPALLISPFPTPCLSISFDVLCVAIT